MSGGDPIVPVTAYTYAYEAHLAQVRLEAAGIEAHTPDGNVLLDAHVASGFRVMTRQSLVERARYLLGLGPPPGGHPPVLELLSGQRTVFRPGAFGASGLTASWDGHGMVLELGEQTLELKGDALGTLRLGVAYTEPPRQGWLSGLWARRRGGVESEVSSGEPVVVSELVSSEGRSVVWVSAALYRVELAEGLPEVVERSGGVRAGLNDWLAWAQALRALGAVVELAA